MSQIRSVISAIIGNLLEHYDSAIFGVLSPFIAPIFFSDQDPMVSLILTYLLIPLGLLMRPLGAVVFGRIGDIQGRKKALSLSLIGMALSTMLIGCLPTYAQVGIYSPLLLIICRLSQGFFAAGETSGGAIYLLEFVGPKKSDFYSSIFDASTILGVFLASLLTTVCVKFDVIEIGWRILFLLGGGVAIIGVRLRSKALVQEKAHRVVSFKMAMQKYRWPFFVVVLTSGFSHATYVFAFTLMVGLIPYVSSLTKTQLLEMNTALLVFDMVALPAFGLIAEKFGRVKVMAMASACAAIFTPIGLLTMDLNSMVEVMYLRGVVVICGVCFAAAYHAYAIAFFPAPVRYTLISVGSAIGAVVLGKPLAAISMCLYSITGSVVSSGVYFSMLGILATIGIIFAELKKDIPDGQSNDHWVGN